MPWMEVISLIRDLDLQSPANYGHDYSHANVQDQWSLVSNDRVETNGWQMDGGDCITWLTNVVGNKNSSESSFMNFLTTPDLQSIFKAELYAILLAVGLIHRCKEKNLVIFSDIMTTLEALSAFIVELDLVYNIMKHYTRLTNNGKTSVLCRIPSNVNIPGIEKADATAESAVSLPVTDMKLQGYELIPRVSKFCLADWQDIWDCCESNKLHSIYTTLGTVIHSKNISHRDSLIINRLRIGHCLLAHLYLLSDDELPTCDSYGLPLTVKHILVECSGLQEIREKYTVSQKNHPQHFLL